MKKHTRLVHWFSCGMIFFFICSALMPLCNTQAIAPHTNNGRMLQELQVKKVKHTDSDDEYFFTYAIIWGTYETKWAGGFLTGIRVFNPGPWYNRTMNVLGYQNWKNQWFFKKSCDVECHYWMGIAVFHHACGIGFDVTAC
jgi:hypothetical protein